jgi:uncharacterized membrane protein YhaH (DUF805 family)
MMSFLSLFSFKGRLSRLPYALVAVPILIGFANGAYVQSVLFSIFQAMKVDLIDFGVWFTSILLVFKLLIVPLLIVTIKRLHDIGLSGFLAISYPIHEGVKMYVGWSLANHNLGQPLPSQLVQQIITYISAGTFIYGLGLALVLCVLPSRKIAPDTSEGAA